MLISICSGDDVLLFEKKNLSFFLASSVNSDFFYKQKHLEFVSWFLFRLKNVEYYYINCLRGTHIR